MLLCICVYLKNNSLTLVLCNYKVNVRYFSGLFFVKLFFARNLYKIPLLSKNSQICIIFIMYVIIVLYCLLHGVINFKLLF